MKTVNLDNPVMSDWMVQQGFRLDPGPYLAGLLEARKMMERVSNTVRLDSITEGQKNGIFRGPKFRRVYVLDRKYGVPFFSTKDMMRVDFSGLPLLKRSDALSKGLTCLKVSPGATLISCSGFNAGRRSYVRHDMSGIWSSEDIIKVIPEPNLIPPGYLYAFLLSHFGELLVKGSVYGSTVKHIEAHHLYGLPVPRFASPVEEGIHDLIEEAARLRAAFQDGLVSASEDFFSSVGLPELIDFRWHNEDRDLGFEVNDFGPSSLRALNFTPRATQLIERLRSVNGKPLGAICNGGMLTTGARFKRMDADPGHGVRLIGQRQAFWVRPEGRWINPAQAPADILQKDETILIAAHGTLGENEVYGRSILATGSWLQHAYSQDFVRLLSGDPEVSGAYLFAFFRSEVAFRILRSLSVGGKQQEYHPRFLRELSIPIAAPADRERIAETVRQAYRDRDRADVLEDEALALLANAIEEAAAA